MCMEVRKTCVCGQHNVQFHLKDNIMSNEVVATLYCPACSSKAAMNETTMLNDNNWIIEYDIELARFLAAAKLSIAPDAVTPGFLFDTGYAAWREMYPGEQQDILEERSEIMSLLQTDPQEYLKQINSWNIKRVEQLKAVGWRKAQAA